MRSPPGGLKRRSLSSGIWSLLELGSSRVLRLLSNLILTRLLMPEAFGLMAMVTTVQIGVTMLSDLGIRQSVIRTTDADDPVFLRTAWTVQALRGTVIMGIIVLAGLALWFLGPKLAAPGTVYADPTLPFLVMVSSLSVQIETLASVNALMANRRMEMRKLALLSISAQVVSILTMVGIATIWPSVWALLIGNIVGTAYRTGLSHLIFSGPRMRPAWDKSVRSELWQFGKWIIGSSAFGFVARHADRLILGALIPSTVFGLYVIALLWIQAFGSTILRLGNQVGLPFLSEIRRERPADLERLFRRYTRVISLMALAGFLLFALVGQVMIDLIYTADYRPAGQFMPLVAFWILAQRFSILSELLVAEGRSFELMLSNALSAATICVAIVVGYAFWGIAGAIAGSVLAPLSGIVLQMIMIERLLGIRLWADWIWLALMTIAAIMVAMIVALPETSP